MIIFVGHSLGGLIIQQALCASKNAVEDYMQAILERTYAIAFLGTPHLGADLAGWAVFGSQVMNALKYSNTNLLDVLRSGSEMLAQIQESFHKTLRLRERNGRPIEITCFYEQLSLRVAGDVSHSHPFPYFATLTFTACGKYAVGSPPSLSPLWNSCKPFG